MNRTEYKLYLQSIEWKQKKELLFSIKGKVCERCKSIKEIQVHHKTYANVFNEKLNDLEVICKKCHYKEHFNKNGKKNPILSVKKILSQKVNKNKSK